MWRPWARPAVSSRSPISPFPFTTLKDVQSLFPDEPSDPDSPRPHHSSGNTPTVLLRRPIPASSSILRTRSFTFLSPDTNTPPPDRIVIYFTGLGVIRPTREACNSVLSILRCFRVRLEERDVSMDPAFLGELQRILGGKERWSLPRVFIGGKYIGGAEEVQRLHEIGELKKMVQQLPPSDPEVCQTCGGYGFVVCGTCYGSHKMFGDKKTGFRRCCNVCNVNGLLRCPSCHSNSLFS
ncbi:hypothetical protein MLD38_003940 [Melastoma candidum]|uniref:Uncharacterized protein n=1 Tax=Melastoma candidum TaxID=119954 RepID=A0ACB9S7A2_9MYRT|nr:hypothetical protein MLD38_003940 [Melastoma candidum]